MPEDPDQPKGRLLTEEAKFAKLQARRRFARAGLAAPIVLGSLVSKPVLGSSWYNCTVSGIMSGNLSSPGDANCSEAGEGLSYWLNDNDWTGIAPVEGVRLVKGDLPDCSSGTVNTGTLFNGFASGIGTTGGLAAKFFFKTEVSVVNDQEVKSCQWATSADGATEASLHQVLASESNEELFHLGRATVVSLLNYYNDPSNYPVTAHTIVAMFNATCDGGVYYLNSAHTHWWTRRQVLVYLTSLYPAG